MLKKCLSVLALTTGLLVASEYAFSQTLVENTVPLMRRPFRYVEISGNVIYSLTSQYLIVGFVDDPSKTLTYHHPRLAYLKKKDRKVYVEYFNDDIKREVAELNFVDGALKFENRSTDLRFIAKLSTTGRYEIADNKLLTPDKKEFELPKELQTAIEFEEFQNHDSKASFICKPSEYRHNLKSIFSTFDDGLTWKEYVIGLRVLDSYVVTPLGVFASLRFNGQEHFDLYRLTGKDHREPIIIGEYGDTEPLTLRLDDGRVYAGTDRGVFVLDLRDLGDDYENLDIRGSDWKQIAR